MAQKLLYELFAILNVDATLYSVHYATTAEVVDGRVVSLVSNSVFDASCYTAKVEVQGQRIFPVGMMVKSACSYHAY